MERASAARARAWRRGALCAAASMVGAWSGCDAGSVAGQPDAGSPPPGFALCGVSTDPAPGVVAAASAAPGDGQVSEHCGAGVPTLDVEASDPFAADRYRTPPDDLVPPFAACVAALEASLASRPSCDQVAGRRLLVSQAGEAEPRWQSGSFDALYATIQDAIDAAAHCDAIVVRPGVYREYLTIDGKDVRISSDTWNEDGTAEDGDERVADYTAERIDLGRYYATGERVVVDTHRTYLHPLRRAVRTVLEGGGYAEGPTRGGTIERDPEDPADPDRGCGNRRPMVDFRAGTTRHTVLDGFTVRLMPQQDHTIPGHGHTLQCRGGSPIIRHNVIYNNGSTGVGVHASWLETTPLTPPCQHDPSLAQETFSNADYRSGNVEYRPVPLVYDNISYQNNGLGLGNNHYSCAAMVGNEAFWNAVPGEEAEHQSPGIGTRHGAKACVDGNIVYENAWTGIAVHQGYLQPEAECAADPAGCRHIDERTQAVVTRNIVFANGSDEAPEDNRGGIAVDGVGLPDEPVSIRENVVFESRVSGIGVRNVYAGAGRGFVLDDTYVEVASNTVFGNQLQGITCQGSEHGQALCTIAGNDVSWNRTGGIGFTDRAGGSALHNVVACNGTSGIQTTDVTGERAIAVYDNVAWANVLAGILDPGSLHDFNLLSANSGKETACSDDAQGRSCRDPQVGAQSGGSAGASDLFVDPRFVDPIGLDFRLGDDSPAIDSGADVSAYYPSWPVAGDGPDRGSHER